MLLDRAAKRGLRVGCAPDTFLGGSHQTCRKLVDEGAIGRPVAGHRVLHVPGPRELAPESWPSTTRRAAGRCWTWGPTTSPTLVNLLGPVEQVAGMTARARERRTITQSTPGRADASTSQVATHVAGTLRFASGAVVSIAMSFDVPQHRHAPIELYGTEATLLVPDPNRFGGAIEIGRNKSWSERPVEHAYADGNYRIIGVADLAHAIRSDRPHRASGELAYHVLEVMEAFEVSSEPRQPRRDRQPPGTAGDAADRSRAASWTNEQGVAGTPLLMGA